MSKYAPQVVLTISLLAGALVTARAQNQDQPSPPAAQTAEPVPQRVRVSAGVTTGTLIKRVNPEYPAEARSQRIQGIVVLNAVISKEGKIVDLKPVSGDPLLTDAAIKAMKNWRYKPFLLQGRSVEVDTQIQVNFTLSGG